MNNQHSIFFLKNGTSYQGVLTKDIFEQFFIEQVGSDRYIYDGDSVLYEIDAQIADIRRKFIERKLQEQVGHPR